MSPTEEFNSRIGSILASPPGEANAEFDRVIMRELLAYTGFKEATQDHPDPFDDPYVGAALFTSDYRLLGAYRKQTSGERHSEPQAIVEALRLKDDAEARAIIADIESAYDGKIWLQTGQRTIFEKHFARAGDYLKRESGAPGLILFSSLEPCGLYEANPSCANIICACRVDRVVYASDDTNPKGRGRPVLEAAGLLVASNVLPQAAVDLNNRFFATVAICNDTYTQYSYRRLFGGAPYALFSEAPGLFQAEVEADGRLNTRPMRPLTVEYVGPEHDVISAFITPRELKSLGVYAIDGESTFYYGGRSLGQLSKLLYRHTQIVGSLPARIVTPTMPFKKVSEAERKLADLLRDRIAFYQNAFRKHHEIWDANRHLILASFRGELRDHISVLVKIAGRQEGELADSPYRFLFVPGAELPERLLKTCREIGEAEAHAARITILGTSATQADLSEALVELGRLGRREGIFDKTSFQVGLLPVTGGGDPDRANELLREATSAMTDVSVECVPWRDLRSQDTARQLEIEIRAGRRDGRFFDDHYIDTLSRSLDWQERKHAGSIGGRLAAGSRDYAEVGVLRKLQRIAELHLRPEDWPDACTRLNAFRNAAPALRAHHSATAGGVLNDIAGALNKLVEAAPPWLDDVIWRWLACWFEVRDPAVPPTPPEALTYHVRREPFLMASAVQYAMRSPEPWAREALAVFCVADGTTPVSAAAGSVAGARMLSSGLLRGNKQHWIPILEQIGQPEVLREEIDWCREARRSELMGLAHRVEAAPDARVEVLPPAAAAYLRSYLALRSLSGELGAVPEVDETGSPAVGRAWRDDHRQILKDVLSFLPTDWRPAALRALAADHDVSLRWAVLYVVLSGDRSLAFLEGESPAEFARAARFRADIVEEVRRAGEHYWLEREILDSFLDAHEQTDDKIQAKGMAFPSAAALGLEPYLAPSQATTWHPELELRVGKLKTRVRRVLLVLPPIEWRSEAQAPRERIQEGTPPLGLGQLAAALGAHGHLVRILDAHRFEYLLDEVAQQAADFDVVGISTVFSTVASATQLTTRIARLSPRNGPRPCIVLGGHAATLSPGRFAGSQAHFDYLVEGPGETALVEIVRASRSDGPVEAAGVYRASQGSPDMKGAGRRRAEAAGEYKRVWDRFPLIDRTIFRSPGNERYEPAPTRNGAAAEAHFVMSKGCDWKCTFCTEAVLAGKREIRRAAAAVVQEVRFVCETEAARHAQFIDDNIFPPLAAPGVSEEDKAERLAWARTFLSGMQDVRERLGPLPEPLTWRGLVRLEDLLAYRESEPSWVESLADSGCALLAFGVEHGNHEVRGKLKAVPNGPGNGDIADLVADLHAAGIAAKAYFIIGGAHDTAALAQETIDFALSSGVDLAYFAIYKDFRGMVETAAGRPRSERTFAQFDFDLGQLANVSDEAIWTRNFGVGLRRTPQEYQTALAQLDALGFKFKALFKYSDYHDDPELGGFYFPEESGGDHEAYFKALRRAYLEFYARPEWAETYRYLLARGY